MDLIPRGSSKKHTNLEKKKHVFKRQHVFHDTIILCALKNLFSLRRTEASRKEASEVLYPNGFLKFHFKKVLFSKFGTLMYGISGSIFEVRIQAHAATPSQ